jgi:5-methylcytosine-specific restriction endonuclease McrA
MNKKQNKKQWQENNIEHIKEYSKRYYPKNKIKILKYGKQWRENNPEYAKEYMEQWRLEHPENSKEYYQNHKIIILEYGKQWRKDNPGKGLIYNKKFRKTEKGKVSRQRNNSKKQAKGREIINTLTFNEWIEILKQYHFRCAYCNKEFDLFIKPTIDHIIPISKGGDNIKENILPACQSCNSKKNNKILRE